MNSVGFTLDTTVWCNSCYRSIINLVENNLNFMTDSFNSDILGFVLNSAKASKLEGKHKVIEVVFGGLLEKDRNKFVRIKCGYNQKFLVANKNNGLLYYNENDDISLVNASELQIGTRLIADDANIVVKEINFIDKEQELYSVTVEDETNFSIGLGVIVEGISERV